MNKAKPAKPEDRDAAIEDPQALRSILQVLFEAETEFPIKVEGTSTLPYASQVQSLNVKEGFFILKLVRPLPHELLAGAAFRMVFAVEDQRLEGLITYAGREAYLQYRFQLPVRLLHSDRRRHKRFPFRPRENAYVIAQDSGIPGLGVAGPLVNIGMGGFAMRVDRVLQLGDGMRIPPNTALFDRGKGFARVRIQELPKLPSLEARGITTHATERGSEVIVGMNFVGLSAEEEATLLMTLNLREKMGRGGQPGQGQAPARPEGKAGPRASGAKGEAPDEEAGPGAAEHDVDAFQGADGQEPASLIQRLQRRTARPEGKAGPRASGAKGEAPDEEAGPGAAEQDEDAFQGSDGQDPLPASLIQRLQRRTARVVVAMEAGERRQGLLELLQAHGFHRLEVITDLAWLKPLCQGDERRSPPRLLLADLALEHTGDQEPMAAARIIEAQAGEAGGLPAVILCEAVDPTLLLGQAEATRFLPYDVTDLARWLGTLDALLES